MSRACLEGFRNQRCHRRQHPPRRVRGQQPLRRWIRGEFDGPTGNKVNINCLTRPIRRDYEEFLVQVVYGPCTDYLSACVDAPYLDFCRTMHGFSLVKERQKIRQDASTKVLSCFKEIRASPPRTQKAFDSWHSDTSKALIRIFRNASFLIFAGQSQKWINITFKNIFVCGESRVPGFQAIYNFCHMPIDNIVLNQLKSRGVLLPPKAWSRWSYGEYYQFQRRLRECCGGQPLLNVEHQIWIDGRKS